MLSSLNGWHWLVLGLVLFILEAIGVGGILVGAGAAAIITAGVLAYTPLEWQYQLVLFGVLAIIATVVFWKFFRVAPAENETSKLNNRMAQLVGIRASVLVEIKGGRGKVQIQDALWTVTCGQDVPAGTLVEITGYDESVLYVLPVSPAGSTSADTDTAES